MKFYLNILALILLLSLGLKVFPQEERQPIDTLLITRPIAPLDSNNAPKKINSNVINSPINYSARDSMPISMENGEQVIHLYGEASIEYGEIKLTADYISVNFAQKEIYAEGTKDSLGNLIGKPHFAEGTEAFDCRTLRYNFVTSKGFTEDVVTEQQDGIVRSSTAKMLNKDVYCMVDGKYSTCDAEHPHFYLQMTKGKVLRNKAIITGRSYLVLEDFPIYFPFLPYGYIPTNNKTYSSGVIIPSYGEQDQWGFYLKEGGFYWAASDYFDVKVTGDIYSKGSWGLNFDSSYRKRYKRSGTLGFNIKRNTTGEKGIDRNTNKSFQIRWSQSQDSKANPSSSFSANVDFSTSGYSTMNEFDKPAYLENSKSSGITYRKNFLNTPFSFTSSMRLAQNTRDSTVSLSLPNLNFNMKTIEPFKRKKSVGTKRFYEEIKILYSATVQNSIKSKESELMKTPFSAWKKGVDHNLPITLPSFKLLNYINFTPSIGYKERWFFDSVEKYWLDGYEVTDNETGLQKWVSGHVEEVRKEGFKRNYEYSGGIGSSTTLYGLYQLKNQNARFKAIRHKMDLSASFNYHPDFGKEHFGGYDWVQVDSLGNYQQYSYFEGGVMSSASRGESGSVSFGMNNNVEMKLAKSSKDSTTTEKFKKVAIFDNIGFVGSYNLAADSMNLSMISLNARTKIAGTSINISGSLDPYALDSKGKRYNEFMWNHATGLGKLGRITSLSTGYSYSYSSDKMKKKEKDKTKSSATDDEKPVEELPGTYSDFKMPWRFSFNYNISYTNPNNNPRVIQSIGFNGGVDFTEKWKSTFSSGFDIEALKLTHTTVSVTRDLHCWSMSFNFSPVGNYPFYSFTLSANAAMLKDLKVNKMSRGGGGYGGY